MFRLLYYWYNLALFGYVYFRYNDKIDNSKFWIVSTYKRGSVNTTRMKDWSHIKQYLKTNKNTVKTHYISDRPLPERYLHNKFNVIILGY